MMLNLRRTGLILSLKNHVLLFYRIFLQFLISVKIFLCRKVWSEIEPSQKHAAGHSTTTTWLHPTFHTTSTFCWLQINLRNMLSHISHRVLNFPFCHFLLLNPSDGDYVDKKVWRERLKPDVMDSLSYTKRYTTPFLNMKRITHVMMMMTMITNVMMMTSQFQLNMMERLKKQEVDHIHHLTFASQKDKMVKTMESY